MALVVQNGALLKQGNALGTGQACACCWPFCYQTRCNPEWQCCNGEPWLLHPVCAPPPPIICNDNDPESCGPCDCCCGSACVPHMPCENPAIYVDGRWASPYDFNYCTHTVPLEMPYENVMGYTGRAAFVYPSGQGSGAWIDSIDRCSVGIGWFLEPCVSDPPFPYDPDQIWSTNWKVCGINQDTGRIALQFVSKALVTWNSPEPDAEEPNALFESVMVELDCNGPPASSCCVNDGTYCYENMTATQCAERGGEFSSWPGCATTSCNPFP